MTILQPIGTQGFGCDQQDTIKALLSPSARGRRVSSGSFLCRIPTLMLKLGIA